MDQEEFIDFEEEWPVLKAEAPENGPLITFRRNNEQCEKLASLYPFKISKAKGKKVEKIKK